MSIKKIKNRLVLYVMTKEKIKPIIETHIYKGKAGDDPCNCYKLNYIIGDDNLIQVFLKEIPDLDKYNKVHCNDITVEPFELSVTVKTRYDSKIIKKFGSDLTDLSYNLFEELDETANYYSMKVNKENIDLNNLRDIEFVMFTNVLNDICYMFMKEGGY